MATGYDFSQTYPASVVTFSPGTTFLATAVGARVVVRSSATLAIVRSWVCVPPDASTSRPTSTSTSADVAIDSLAWSADGLYLLAFAAKSAVAWVFGLAHEGDGAGGEMARIGAGGFDGIVKVEWGSAGDVLAWSDYGIKLSIHDLATGTTADVHNPKSTTAYAYAPDGRYLAIAERHGGKEHVGVYDAHDGYRLVRHFPIATIDVFGLAWSPDGKWIAAWESPLSYAVHIYSPIGPHLSTFSPASPTFTPAEDPGLGIRVVEWVPGGRYLALGGWDGRVRVLEAEGWRCVATLTWGARTAEKGTTVWKEPADWISETRGRGIVQFERLPVPAHFPIVRPDLSRPNPRTGVSQLALDADAAHLAVVLDTQPCVVHIHTFLPSPTAGQPDIRHLTSAVFSNPIVKVGWSPGNRRLGVVTRSQAVYLWDGEGGWVDEDDEEGAGGLMEGVGVPSRTDFSASDLVWAPDGRSLAIQSRAAFCVLYDDAEAEAEAGIAGGAATSAPRTPRTLARWSGQDEGLSEVLEEDETYEAYEGYDAEVAARLPGLERAGA
ncbi:hypothetical protein Q5752_004205 [Cryptotrichosporon argae]